MPNCSILSVYKLKQINIIDMITINHAKLQEVIAGYKQYFPTHIADEIYKWKAVKHFQDHWDIEAPDFLAMF